MAKAKAAPEADKAIGGEGQEEKKNTYFAEWDCEVKYKEENGKQVPYAEKLKISRPKVGITETEAETLNDGLLTGGNKYVKLYFPAE